MDVRYAHVPVLADTLAALLVQNPGGLYVDGTVGGGGHAAAILARLDARGRIIGIDKDMDAIMATRERFHSHQARVTTIHGDFSDLPTLLTARGTDTVDGIVFDLGVSSYQIDTPGRGFSYTMDGPLDMRMDPTCPMTASTLINQSSPPELERIIFDYGEERLAKRIVRAIVDARQRSPITTTNELVALIKPIVKHQPLYKTCARVFQAIRIAVNDELNRLHRSLSVAVSILRPKGRFGIITYHSLEDRLVKHSFRDLAHGCTCPPEMPQCVCGQQPVVTVLTKRPLYPSKDEVQINPRARSAKLRMVERLSDSSRSMQVLNLNQRRYS